MKRRSLKLKTHTPFIPISYVKMFSLSFSPLRFSTLTCLLYDLPSSSIYSPGIAVRDPWKKEQSSSRRTSHDYPFSVIYSMGFAVEIWDQWKKEQSSSRGCRFLLATEEKKEQQVKSVGLKGFFTFNWPRVFF